MAQLPSGVDPNSTNGQILQSLLDIAGDVDFSQLLDAKLPPFIDPKSPEGVLLSILLTIAGPNFQPPYIGDQQPQDIIEANDDFLLNFDGPGGTKMKGMSFPGGNIGMAINTLMMVLSPFMSGFSLLMPIFGVIIGILEVICALLSPFAVPPVVKKLFEKYLPPLLSLFPPISGAVLMMSIIKLLIAIAYYVLTEVVPTVELIVQNAQALEEALKNPEDVPESRISAVEAKIENVVDTLVQKLGLLAMLKPLIEIAFAIMKLLAGVPCVPNRRLGTGDCCGSEFCPDILYDPPQGSPKAMFLGPYGPIVPDRTLEMFLYIIPSAKDIIEVKEIKKFHQNLGEQLAYQVDEGVNEGTPAGGNPSELSTLKVTLQWIIEDRWWRETIPVHAISDSGFFVVKLPTRFKKIVSDTGSVPQNGYYWFKPNWSMLIAQSLIGLGCDPGVIQARENISDIFPELDGSGLDYYPEAGSTPEENDNYLEDMDRLLQDPVNNRDDIVIRTIDYIATLKDISEATARRAVNPAFSLLEVDKTEVAADNEEIATITVTPRGAAGTNLYSNLTEGTTIPVEILVDFGTLSEQTINRTAGTVTATLKSPTIGLANIRAKVMDQLIVDLDAENNQTIAVRQVRFVADAKLPLRRKRTKPTSGRPEETGQNTNRRPGKR